MRVDLLLTALLALFAAGQVYVIRQQRLLAELQVVHELSAQWQSMTDEWIGLLLAGGHLYLGVSDALAGKYPVLTHERIGEYRRLVHFNRHGESWSEITAGLSDDEVSLLSHGSALDFPEEFHRRPCGLLATICAYILRGRLSVSAAYEVLGSDLVRNSSSIRYVTDAAPASTYYFHYYPGVRRRVLILLDLMWAEAAKRGDLSTMEQAKAAEIKRSSRSGLRNRKRLRAEARQLGTLATGSRLAWHLTAAERLDQNWWVVWALRRIALWFGDVRSCRAEYYPERSLWRTP